MIQYELYIYPLGQLGFATFFCLVGIFGIVYTYLYMQEQKNRSWKRILLIGAVSILFVGAAVEMGEIAIENASYTWKVWSAKKVTIGEKTLLSGFIKRGRNRAGEVLIYRDLKINSGSKNYSVNKVVDTFHSSDFMNPNAPDNSIIEFSIEGTTYFSEERPYLFIHQDKRLWFEF